MASDDPSSGTGHESVVHDGVSALSFDNVFEVLANRRRRIVIYSLLEASSGIITFDDLVQDVTSIESDDDAAPAGGGLPETVATDLHCWHLPVLEDVGVISYDDRSQIVQYHGDPLLDTWAKRVATAELE